MKLLIKNSSSWLSIRAVTHSIYLINMAKHVSWALDVMSKLACSGYNSSTQSNKFVTGRCEDQGTGESKLNESPKFIIAVKRKK